MHVYNAMSALVRWLHGTPNGLVAGTWTAYLCGGVFVVALLGYVRALRCRFWEGLLLFAGLASAGYAAQFFGYIETTSLGLAALALFFAASAAALHSAPGRPRTLALAGVFAALGIACTAHVGAATLLPACVALLAARGALDHGWPRGAVRGLTDPRAWGAFALLGVVPFVLLVVLPFYVHGNFGNVMGGADRYRFVPWSYDQARLVSNNVYYGMLSRLHFDDVASAFWIAAPLAIPQSAAAGWLLWTRRVRLPAEEMGLLFVLLVAAAASTGMVLVWQFDFGIWGDWNIASCYLMPLALLGWTAFTCVARRAETGGLFLGLGVPMLVVQALLALGIILQLHA
jgi:hypothetical protein